MYGDCGAGSELESIPGHQPGVDVWHVAQVTGVHKDHATAGDSGWRGILQVTHLRLAICHIRLSKLASSVRVTTKQYCLPPNFHTDYRTRLLDISYTHVESSHKT